MIVRQTRPNRQPGPREIDGHAAGSSPDFLAHWGARPTTHTQLWGGWCKGAPWAHSIAFNRERRTGGWARVAHWRASPCLLMPQAFFPCSAQQRSRLGPIKQARPRTLKQTANGLGEGGKGERVGEPGGVWAGGPLGWNAPIRGPMASTPVPCGHNPAYTVRDTQRHPKRTSLLCLALAPAAQRHHPPPKCLCSGVPSPPKHAISLKAFAGLPGSLFRIVIINLGAPPRPSRRWSSAVHLEHHQPPPSHLTPLSCLASCLVSPPLSFPSSSSFFFTHQSSLILTMS